jgi:hypothetical protein
MQGEIFDNPFMAKSKEFLNFWEILELLRFFGFSGTFCSAVQILMREPFRGDLNL